jgi:hypothetical protein
MRNVRLAACGVAGIAIGSILSGCDGPGQDSTARRIAHLTAAATVRIGSIDDSLTALTRIPAGGIAVGTDGTIYVAQPADQNIRVYTHDGKFVNVFGGRGSGPGEFRYLTGIGVIGDTVYALELSPPRISLFSADGGFLDAFEWVVAAEPGYASVPPYAIGRGLLFGVASPPALAMSADPRRSRVISHVLVDRLGNVVDTMLAFDAARIGVPIRQGLRVASFQDPFPDYPLLALTSDGMQAAVVRRDASTEGTAAMYQVTWLTVSPSAAESRLQRRYEVAPIRMDPSRLRTVLEAFGQLSSDPRAFEDVMDQLLQRREYLPPVGTAVYGSDGILWIARENGGSDSQLWELLDFQGELVGQVQLPARFSARVAGRSSIYGVEHDQLDVPYIVRYDIVERH